MLTQLYIENVAVIEKVDIQFQNGLNVFTGETGAGKSILIDAVNAILGTRTSKSIIRHGMEKAEIYAVFSHVPKHIWDLVKEFDIDKDDNLILFRQIYTDGRNVCKINGKPATVQMLRSVGSQLIHIHGQHDNQFLLDENNHLGFIDSFGNIEDDLITYKDSFSKLMKTKKELDKLLDLDFDKEKRLELLEYQIDEIEKANLEEGEEENLKKQRLQYQNSETVLKALADTLALLNGEELELNGISVLSAATSNLQAVSEVSPELQKLSEQANNIYYSLEELTQTVRGQVDEYTTELDIDQIEERLKFISDMKNKYGSSIEEIENYLAEAKREVSLLQNQEVEVAQLEAKAEEYLQEVETKGEYLTQKRKQTAEEFCKQVKAQLTFLNMPNVTVEPQFETTKFTSHGKDSAVLLFSTNPGQPPKSISKVASGGELSRIMLAIKTISAQKDNISTLIFDEIDTGVSGSGSVKIGLKLKEVAQHTQVICVTHSPSIAAYANTHFFIDKEVKNNQTYSSVTRLSFEERAGELARIIAGDSKSEQTLQTAKELLLNAQKEDI